MSNAPADSELLTLLSQYASGTVSAETIQAMLQVPRLQAMLQALVGTSMRTPQGDQITVGNIADAKGVAIGAGALAIGELIVQVTRPDAAVKIDNTQANQGAQGVFHGPVTINYGNAGVPPEAATPVVPPQRSGVAALKRGALERRIAALTEEYTAVHSQIDTTIDAAQRLRLQRRADDLFAEIEQNQAELDHNS